MGKINPNGTLQDIILTLAEGNPGALTCIMELLRTTSDHMMNLLHVIKFDDYEMYGSLIYIVWNDLLDRDTPRMYDLLKENKLKEFVMEEYSSNERFKHEWDYSGGKKYQVGEIA